MGQQFQEAIAVLRRGGVVAFPTDTLYGLGADALNTRAVERLFSIKARPRDMALPLLLADVEDISSVAIDIPDEAWLLAKRFLPGPLTLLLYKARHIPDIVTAGSPKVAVRVPDHPVPRALAKGLGRPITGTSANLSGSPGATIASQVREQLGSAVELIIDGGPTPGDTPSTVVDVTEEGLRVVREGVISGHDLEEACGVKVLLQGAPQ